MALSHNQQILLTRQRHEAEKMGLHWDYRIVVGGKAYSWATKKELPEPGKAILLHEQPIHTAHYALSERVVIPSGQYGGGVTTLDWVRKGTIKNPEESKDKFVIEVSNGERFLLKKMPQYSDKAWLFKNLGTALEKTASKIPIELLETANKEFSVDNWAGVGSKRKRVGIYEKGVLVGFYSPIKRDGVWSTGTIWISPEHRNKGLGSKTIRDFFNEKGSGFAHIEPTNLSSLKAFKNAGFEEHGIKDIDHGNNEIVKYIMLKNLTKAEPEMENKYLQKIAVFRAARKPAGKWSKEEFQGRFTEMFDKAVNKRQLDAEKVKGYRWKNAIGMADEQGQLARLLVPSKTEPGKHLELKHSSYKK